MSVLGAFANSRTFPKVAGKHVVFSPAAVALATLFYQERRKPDAVYIAVRRSLLAAKVASIFLHVTCAVFRLMMMAW